MFEEFEHLNDAELANFSTMKIGGWANWLIFPKNVQELKKILKICHEKEIKTFILGNGSNVLFDDAGFDGAVICLRHFSYLRSNDNEKFKKNKKREKRLKIKNQQENFENEENQMPSKKQQRNRKIQKFKRGQKCRKNVQKSGFFDAIFPPLKLCNKPIWRVELNNRTRCVEVGAGINLFSLNMQLAKLGLSGLEFCYGIPATLGGFLVMNGGCFGHEICEIVEEVQVLQDGKILWRTRDECDFSYRHSNLQNCVVLGAKLRLLEEKSENIVQNMNFFLEKKRASQPCDLPSLGCVFKAANGVSVGKILDDMGLKGFCIGRAQVSTKHAGFIVNMGGATAKDVTELIKFLEVKLLEAGVKAEREIIVLPSQI